MPDWYEDLYYEESDNARPWAWNEASKHLGKLDTQEVIALLRDMAGDRTSSLTNLVWFHVMRDRPATEVAEIYEGSMEGINSGSSRLSPMKFAIRDNASIGKAKALEIFRALWERGREPIDGQDVEKGIKDPTRQWPMQLLQVPENETNFQQGSCWTIAVDREFKSAVNADAAVSLANKYIPEYQALSWTKTTESSIPQVDFSRFKRMMDGNHEEYPAANAFSQYLESLPLEQRTAVVNAAM
ncbi:MAG TPA: hypothetical protein VIT68_00250, partial [Candidatus Gracilibacteria bacterium]